MGDPREAWGRRPFKPQTVLLCSKAARGVERWIRRAPMRVNIRWRSGDRAGRARLSETAGSPATHRPIRPKALPLAAVLGLTGRDVSAVVRRHFSSMACATTVPSISRTYLEAIIQV